MQLDTLETRVIGVLMEKSITTPDQYPLSLNALTTGCNQKTNREPVLELSESDVQAIVDSLLQKRLLSEVRFGGRVPKYQHRFCGTEFSEYKFTTQEQAIVCLLFLRGAQTAGELRTRSNRLCDFTGVHQTENVLEQLIEKNYVQKLVVEPGRREARYGHLFGDEEATEKSVDDEAGAPASNLPQPEATSALEDRVELLEAMVEELQDELASIKNAMAQKGA
ncbi:YceH family protein [Teredinibacter haidensis]|uniref:YceH family protein n=1 Tax=Teredinibacter haidensis TaxID=2731755 RepID=UPI0009490FFE|nr:YceH family protein [Teredinibacter haidensis]